MRGRKSGDEMLIGCVVVIFIVGVALFYLLPVILLVGVVVIPLVIIKRSLSAKPKKAVSSIDLSQVDVMDGITFENFVATVLRQTGYSKVEVTKASGDYGVDIGAWKDGSKYAFQCKRYSKNLGVKPIQEVYSGKSMYKAEKCVVVTNTYFTENAVKLANKLGVELWDRNRLKRMMVGISDLTQLK